MPHTPTIHLPSQQQKPHRFRKAQALSPKSPTGFSLLELAIALAVLAVLAGGVLKGSELVQSAKVQSTVTELASLDTALSAFEARYAALPGDFSGAGAAGLGGFSGDGNGVIDTGEEEGAVFEHLRRAGFIKGDYTAADLSDTDCTAQSCVNSPLGGFFLMSSTLSTANPTQGRVQMLLGSANTAKRWAEIDRKIDDGLATTGAVRIAPTEGNNCVTQNGRWDENSSTDCQAVYTLR